MSIRELRNITKNKKWIAALHYPDDVEKGDWYFTTTAGFHTDDEQKRLSSVFVEISCGGISNPDYIVGYVQLNEPIEVFRAEFLKLVREAIAKVDLMNGLGINDLSTTNKCANCDNDAAADDFLCQSCRDNV